MLGHRDEILIEGEAATAREALEVLAAVAVDVALIGPTLPRHEALETSRRITAHEGRVRTIMLANTGSPSTVLAAVRHGCHGFCRYDTAAEVLAIAVRAASRGHAFLYPRITRSIINHSPKPTSEGGEQYWLLTPRQRVVLQMVVDGSRTREIAHALGVTTKTIESHRDAIMRRLGVSRVVELVHEAVRLGLTPRTK